MNKLIKKFLKKHLRIDIDYQQPMSMFDGFIITSIYWDDTLICQSKKEFKKSFF